MNDNINFYPEQKQDLEKPLEEGEVKVFDDENYIISDKLFKFNFDNDKRINWRNISKVDMRALSNGEDLSDIFLNIEDIAHTNIEEERNTKWISPEGRDAMRIMQAGMQYLMFAQQQMVQKLSLLQTYTQKQNEQLANLETIQRQQKSKMKRYRKLNSKLNEQAIHFEILINKMRPDLLNERLKTMGALARPDVRRVDGDIVADILKEKGVIRDGQRTIFDHFRSTKSDQEDINNRLIVVEQENQEPNQQETMMKEIMDALKNIQSKMDQGITVQQQQYILQEVVKSINLDDELKHSNSAPIKKPQILIEKLVDEGDDEYKEDFEGSQNSKPLSVEELSFDNMEQPKSTRSAQSHGKKNSKTAMEIEEIMKEQKSQKYLRQKSDEKLKSPNRKETLKKHQTPIKEEEIEEEESEVDIEDISSNPTNSKVFVEIASNFKYAESKEESGEKGGSLTPTNQRMEQPIDQFSNRPETPMVPLFQRPETPLINLSNRRKVEEEKAESEPKEESIPDDIEEEEDEYKDDDFEEASQASGTDQKGTLSQSGLPPLAGGKLAKSQLLASQADDKKNLPLPQDFNLNIAESQMSIDFDLSESKIMQTSTGHASKKGSISLMKKKIDELNESDDFEDSSNDFQVSESGFSQSFRSKQPLQKQQQQKKQPGQAKDFYYYQQEKFTSYNKQNTNNSIDEDEDF